MFKSSLRKPAGMTVDSDTGDLYVQNVYLKRGPVVFVCFCKCYLREKGKERKEYTPPPPLFPQVS